MSKAVLFGTSDLDFGSRVGGYIVIRRLAAQQEIADTSAHQVALMAVMAQGRANLFG